jgi:hypothetical protein
MAKKAAKKLPKAVRDFFVQAGRKGGLKKGPTKARDPEKMRAAQKLRWAKKQAPPADGEPGTENAEH